MNRVARFRDSHFAVAAVFLCILALTLCQVLGPTARLNHSFWTSDFSETAFIAASEHIAGASGHSSLPSHCAVIKLAPVEIKAGDFVPTMVDGGPALPSTSTFPLSAELGVPTPPPRSA
jgi:hypothetical protein